MIGISLRILSNNNLLLTLFDLNYDFFKSKREVTKVLKLFA